MSEKTDAKMTPKVNYLGKQELYALAIGQVIGAGVVTVLGSAIAATGKSVWLAYFVAVLLGFLNILPTFLMTSFARLKGGSYSMVSGLLGKQWAGFFLISYIPNSFSFSLFGISLGMYTSSLIPALSPRLVGFAVLTLFYVINLLSIKSMARIQKYMTWLLIGTLLMFIAFGLPKVSTAPFEFSSPDYFSGGSSGFITAVILLVYSTTSYSMVANYSGVAKSPKKDLPKIMILCVITIAIIYSGAAIVASGVLPIADVAGKPLTYVAKIILPKPLFLLFIFGGVMMALATTLNSMFGSFGSVYQQGARDGWFPEWLAKNNRFGQPYVLFTITYIIGVLPIVLGFDINTITNNIVLLTYISGLIPKCAVFMLPKLYPEVCAKSKLYGSKTRFNITMSISIFSSVIVMVLSANALSMSIVLASLSALTICVLYVLWRVKTNKVHIQASFVVDDNE